MSERVAKIQQGLLIVSFGVGMGALGLWIRPTDKQMGILQMESYQYVESEQRLLNAYQQKPEDLLTLKSLSRIYGILGKPELEIRYLNEYIAQAPKDTDTRLHLAEVYLWNLQQHKATEQFLAILEYEPQRIDVLRKLAINYVWEQKLNDAIGIYRKISNLGKLELEDQRQLVNLYVQTSQLDKALRLMEKIHRTHANEVIAQDFLTLADLYSWSNRLSLSDSTLNRMLDQLKDGWEVRMSYVDWYLNIVKPERAIFWLERWSRRDDNMQLPCHEKLVEVLQTELMEFEAIASMERLVQHRDAEERHQVQLFWMLIDAMESEKAWALGTSFSEDVILEENLLQPLVHLAIGFQEFKKAEDWAKTWVANAPDNPEPRQQLYYIYKMDQRPEDALHELKSLLVDFPNEEMVLQLAVDHFLEQKKLYLALEFAQKGLEQGGAPLSFLQAITHCARELQQWELAHTTQLKVLEYEPDSFDEQMALSDINLSWVESEKAPAYILNDTLVLLEKLWREYPSDETKLFRISKNTTWGRAYDRAFEQWTILETFEEGSQYEEFQLDAAMGAQKFFWALPILEQRLELPIFSEKDFLRLVQIYQSTNDFAKEMALLEGEYGKMFMENGPIIRRQSELLFSLQQPEKGIDFLVDYYQNYAPNDDEVKAEILEKALWLKNKKKQLELLQNFGDLKGNDGVLVASMLGQQSRFQESLELLDELRPEIQQTLEAQQLIYWAALELDQQDRAMNALESLAKLEPDLKKRALHQINLASLFHQMGEVDKASDMADKILEHEPQNKRALVIKGYVAYDRKRYSLAADLLLRSQSTEVHDRFLRGAALLRFNAGYREGVRVFHGLLRDYRKEESFKKWNLVLDIGYELNSPFYIERAWQNLMEKYKRDDILPRYALHLMYTDRRAKAEEIFFKLKPNPSPSYQALLKMLNPSKFEGILSNHEKIALSEYSNRQSKWIEAIHWLP